MTSVHTSIERDGFCILPGVLSARECGELRHALEQSGATQLTRRGAVYGARNLLGDKTVRDVAQHPAIRAIVDQIPPPPARAVRALFFDKTEEANWHVPWHQDLVLAVTARHEVEGWGPWTVKAGVPHVEAPPQVLASMLTLRLHLDDCDEDNGPLRVLPGTHRMGRLLKPDIDRVRENIAPRACPAPAGSVLAMRPLLLHASSRAEAPRHRRVLHLEFAPANLLPPPLAWASDPP